MTKVIGITGARKLTRMDEYNLRPEMGELLKTVDKVHIGDADGVDAIAHEIALKRGKQVTLHETEGLKPYQLQQRSKRMVLALMANGGTLHAFVTKPCPTGVTVNSWAGSGTWGTIRYAIAKCVPVELHWLIEPCELPDWMVERQLTLRQFGIRKGKPSKLKVLLRYLCLPYVESRRFVLRRR